jgi:hypothetical protein
MFPDGSERPNPDVIRVAAHAAILVYEKYVPKLHECEIYAISIGLLLCFSPYSVDVTHDFSVMSPDKKLAWFNHHGYTESEVLDIRDTVRNRWTKDYSPGVQVSAPAPIRNPLLTSSRKVGSSAEYFYATILTLSLRTACFTLGY